MRAAVRKLVDNNQIEDILALIATDYSDDDEPNKATTGHETDDE
jgi:hypothetical protein